jgi:hypothetical protein
MLFCRSIPTRTLNFNAASKFVGLATPHTLVSSKSQYQQRLNHKTDETSNPSKKPLLQNINSNNSKNSNHRYQ